MTDTNPLAVNKTGHENNSRGASPEKSCRPRFVKASLVCAEIWTLWGPPHCEARKPPTPIPATKRRFQMPVRFQSYRKYSIRPGSIAEHICRRLLETPNIRLPTIKRAGTNNPITGPAMYHGHGADAKAGISDLVYNAMLSGVQRLSFVLAAMSDLRGDLAGEFRAFRRS